MTFCPTSGLNPTMAGLSKPNKAPDVTQAKCT